jgi:hypothetical protein
MGNKSRPLNIDVAGAVEALRPALPSSRRKIGISVSGRLFDAVGAIAAKEGRTRSRIASLVVEQTVAAYAEKHGLTVDELAALGEG